MKPVVLGAPLLTSTCPVLSQETLGLQPQLMIIQPHHAAGNTLKLHYAHNLDAARTAGAEVTRPINGGDTKAVVGYSHRLQDGAVSKLRIDTGGLLTILYEQVGPAAVCLPPGVLLSRFDGQSQAQAMHSRCVLCCLLAASCVL